MSANWALNQRIMRALRFADGQTDGELAKRLGVPLTDARQAARVLYRMGRTDFCYGRIVLVPVEAAKRGAA